MALPTRAGAITRRRSFRSWSNEAGVYFNRVTGRNCDHWASGGAAIASAGRRAGGRQKGELPLEPAPDGPGHSCICGGQRGKNSFRPQGPSLHEPGRFLSFHWSADEFVVAAQRRACGARLVAATTPGQSTQGFVLSRGRSANRCGFGIIARGREPGARQLLLSPCRSH